MNCVHTRFCPILSHSNAISAFFLKTKPHMLSLRARHLLLLPTIALHPKPKNFQAYVINVKPHH